MSIGIVRNVFGNRKGWKRDVNHAVSRQEAAAGATFGMNGDRKEVAVQPWNVENVMEANKLALDVEYDRADAFHFHLVVVAHKHVGISNLPEKWWWTLV